MGQIFNVLFESPDGGSQNYGISCNKKLTEHAWWGDTECNEMAKQIYQKPAKIAWVGDYYNETAEETALFNRAFAENEQEIRCTGIFTLDDKYLVNHDKKIYVDLNEYKDKSIDSDFNESTHPLPLLTACGNGRGGGDYYSPINNTLIGTWAMDTISIENEVPKGCKKLNVWFTEDRDAIKEWNRNLSLEKSLYQALNTMDVGDSLTVKDFGKAAKIDIEKDYDEDTCEYKYDFRFFVAAPNGKFVSNNNLEIGTAYDIYQSELAETFSAIKEGSLKLLDGIKTVVLSEAIQKRTAKIKEQIER